VLHGGQLVESGTHEELWARRGRYFDLFRSHRDEEPVGSAGRVRSS
jgi:ABC-type multidrug transport system fused ATPase/permease subunit